jgi:hypothetical protein
MKVKPNEFSGNSTSKTAVALAALENNACMHAFSSKTGSIRALLDLLGD